MSPPLDGRCVGRLVSHKGAPARAGRPRPRDALDGLRHHERARAPRERLSGAAACDRLSRSRAGRLFLRRARRLDLLYQCDAGRMARLRSRAIRARPAQAVRHSRRRRRALVGVVSGRPGEVKTEQFDVDLKRRKGRFLPVRILHRVAFSSDGSPGPSRSLVINRAPGEIKARRICARRKCALRGSSIRPRWGSPRSTRPARFCAPTPPSPGSPRRALKPAPAREAVELSSALPSATAPALREAMAAAAEGKGEITPVDAALQGETRRVGALLRFGRRSASGEDAAVATFLRSTRPSSARCRRISRRARRCRRSANWPAASPMTSTMC